MTEMPQVEQSSCNAKGETQCSDEMLNQIHRASVRSTFTNCFGISTDYPRREQLSWTGDAAISAEQSIIPRHVRTERYPGGCKQTGSADRGRSGTLPYRNPGNQSQVYCFNGKRTGGASIPHDHHPIHAQLCLLDHAGNDHTLQSTGI